MINYLSPDEVARRYNITGTTVRTWIRQGKLKATRVGKLWRIAESDLEEFIREQQQEVRTKKADGLVLSL